MVLHGRGLWNAKHAMGTNIARLLDGDKAEWDAFVERFTPVVWAAVKGSIFAHAGSVNEEDVREIVQSVFVRLVARDFRLLKSYDPGKASLVTWLTIVSRSAAIDSLRRRRLPLVPLDDQAMDAPAPEPAPTGGIELPPNLLSPRQKLVLHLLCDDAMETSEIAAMLGVDAQTVRSTIHKAVSRLRSHYKKNP